MREYVLKGYSWNSETKGCIWNIMLCNGKTLGKMMPVIIWKVHYILLSSRGGCWKESNGQHALANFSCITKKVVGRIGHFLQANMKGNHMSRNIRPWSVRNLYCFKTQNSGKQNWEGFDQNSSLIFSLVAKKIKNVSS